MKPQTIAITRKFNLGNYQSMDIHVEASLNEGENAINALHELERILTIFGKIERINLFQ